MTGPTVSVRCATRLGRAVASIAALFVLVVAVLKVARRPGRWMGIRYRLLGRHPDPDVDDRTLADRIRSSLGPLEKRLDVPHVHVLVEDHVALLHGDVGWPREAAAIERAVSRVAGVRGVESHLHVGLLHGDQRPSQGRRVPLPPTDAKQRLLAAARSAGVDEADAVAAVRATLSVLAERIPAGEREQLLLHLPADVRALASVAGPTAAPAPGVLAAVFGELRRLVPEEDDDVAAVLPRELRELWSAPA